MGHLTKFIINSFGDRNSLTAETVLNNAVALTAPTFDG